MTWSAGITTIVASGSWRLTSSAARPMHGAVSRLHGSPTIAAAGSSGNCWRTAATSRSFVTTSRRSVGHQVAQSIERLAEHRCLAHQPQQLLRRVVPARGPESGAGAAGHDDRVEHGRVESRGLSVESRNKSHFEKHQIPRKRTQADRLLYVIMRKSEFCALRTMVALAHCRNARSIKRLGRRVIDHITARTFTVPAYT